MGKISVTRAALAKEFERDKETITRWLVAIGVTHNEALSPSEIERFYRQYGSSSLMPALRQMNLFANAISK